MFSPCDFAELIAAPSLLFPPSWPELLSGKAAPPEEREKKQLLSLPGLNHKPTSEKTSVILETKMKSAKTHTSLLSRYPRQVDAGDGDGVADNYPKLEESNSRRSQTVLLSSESRQSYLKSFGFYYLEYL